MYHEDEGGYIYTVEIRHGQKEWSLSPVVGKPFECGYPEPDFSVVCGDVVILAYSEAAKALEFISADIGCGAVEYEYRVRKTTANKIINRALSLKVPF